MTIATAEAGHNSAASCSGETREEGSLQARWQEGQSWLRFSLGEISLFRVGLRVMRRAGHFSVLDGDPDSLSAELDRLDGSFQAVLVRGQMIDRHYPRLAILPRAVRDVAAQYDNFVTDLGGTFEQYTRRLGKHSLQECRRKARRIADRSGGTLDVREYRTPEAMAEFHRLAREISVKTYQERLLNAGLPEDPEAVAMMERHAAGDAIRAYLLFLEGQAIAYSYALISEGVVAGQYLGYDPQHRKLGPGSVLQTQRAPAAFPGTAVSFLRPRQGRRRA